MQGKNLKGYDAAARAAVISLSYEILSGRLGVIEGSRLLWRSADELTTSLPTEFDVFVSVDAQTDHLSETDDSVEWTRSERALTETVRHGCEKVLSFLGDPRQQAIESARSVMDGNLRIFAGARSLSSLLSENPDFALFGTLVSELDDLPIDVDPALWHADLLIQTDNAIASWEEQHRDEVLQLCRTIVEEFTRYDLGDPE